MGRQHNSDNDDNNTGACNNGAVAFLRLFQPLVIAGVTPTCDLGEGRVGERDVRLN